MKKIFIEKNKIAIISLLIFFVNFEALSNSLVSIKTEARSNDEVVLTIELKEPLKKTPKTFSTENPPTIAIDFDNTSTGEIKEAIKTSDNSLVKDIVTVAVAERSRVIVNLKQAAKPNLTVSNTNVIVSINRDESVLNNQPISSASQITSIDFEDINGVGRISVDINDTGPAVNIEKNNNELFIIFNNTKIPSKLIRTLDVSSFSSPISKISSYEEGKNAVISIANDGIVEHSAYQANKKFILEIQRGKILEEANPATEFSGERLSLNFQSIEVRAILQLLADFTDKNLVASDSVGGTITLRLKNVPWDQALDIILKARGLGKREVGNVMMIAPQEELAARERLELESKQQVLELSPLVTEFIQVNYAKASDMANLIRDEANNLISERGNVTVDERTNTLLIQETTGYLSEIKKILKALDIPVRQVQIESKIVVANDDFSKDLGVKLGYNVRTAPITIDGGKSNFSTIVGGGISGDTPVDAVTGFSADPASSSTNLENYQVSLPIPGPTAALKMMVGRQGSYLLNLELQAAQAEGRGEIISSPTVITANQRQATIESGTEIPFLEASSSGATAVSFKKAVLSLKVTPQITPDNKIIMDLSVNKDSVGTIFSGIPSIDTNNLITQVLVDNGETVVLGGVYESTDTNNSSSVPLLGDIPYVGRLFRNKTKNLKKKELLVFITPQIIDEAFPASIEKK